MTLTAALLALWGTQGNLGSFGLSQVAPDSCINGEMQSIPFCCPDCPINNPSPTCSEFDGCFGRITQLCSNGAWVEVVRTACGGDTCTEPIDICGVCGGDGSSCAVQTYACTGTAPTNAALCTGDDASLTADTARVLAATCSAPEGSTPKCQYACSAGFVLNATQTACVAQTYTCTGANPTNATLCTGSDQGLTANTPKVVAASCSGAKCEFTCNAGTSLQNGACVATPAACLATITPQAVVAPTGNATGTLGFTASYTSAPTPAPGGTGSGTGTCTTYLVITDSASDACLSGGPSDNIPTTCPLTGAGAKVRYSVAGVPRVSLGSPTTLFGANGLVNYTLSPNTISGAQDASWGATITLNPSTTYYWKVADVSAGIICGTTANGPWFMSFGLGDPACSVKGSFTTPAIPAAFSCTGADPANATLCPGSADGLTANTPKTVVSSCQGTTTDPVQKCAYVCVPGFENQNGTCIATPPQPSSIQLNLTVPLEGRSPTPGGTHGTYKASLDVTIGGPNITVPVRQSNVQTDDAGRTVASFPSTAIPETSTLTVSIKTNQHLRRTVMVVAKDGVATLNLGDPSTYTDPGTSPMRFKPFLPAGDIEGTDDVLHDNKADLFDIGAWIEAFRLSSANSVADLDGNSAVGSEDLSLIIRNFNSIGDPVPDTANVCAAQGSCRNGQLCPAGTECSQLPAYGCYPIGCPFPTCLAGSTRIATADGDVAARDITVGMRVWTKDAAGSYVVAPVLRVGKTLVPSSHMLVRLVLQDGRVVSASPGHPTVDGRTLDQLAAGDAYDGSSVVSVARVPINDDATYDLLPASASGAYLADGIWLGSTLTPTAP